MNRQGTTVYLTKENKDFVTDYCYENFFTRQDNKHPIPNISAGLNSLISKIISSNFFKENKDLLEEMAALQESYNVLNSLYRSSFDILKLNCEELAILKKQVKELNDFVYSVDKVKEKVKNKIEDKSLIAKSIDIIREQLRNSEDAELKKLIEEYKNKNKNHETALTILAVIGYTRNPDNELKNTIVNVVDILNEVIGLKTVRLKKQWTKFNLQSFLKVTTTLTFFQVSAIVYRTLGYTE